VRRPELLLGAVLALFAAFVGTQILGAPRRTDAGAAPHYAATDDARPDAGTAMAPVAAPDPAVAAATRRRIAAQSYGTYLGEILAAQDSALARWPDHASAPIRVWVQPTSTVEGWTPQFPQYGRDAFLGWEQVGLPIRFAFVNDSAAADAQLVWVHHLEPAPRIGSTLRMNDRRGWVVSGFISVATHGSDGRVLGETVIRTTALHEVGHLIGLNHTTDTTSIMAAELSESHLLSASDKATALLLYDLPPGSLK
jgi:hypothetical protein